jgi:hypothetical protein
MEEKAQTRLLCYDSHGPTYPRLGLTKKANGNHLKEGISSSVIT